MPAVRRLLLCGAIFFAAAAALADVPPAPDYRSDAAWAALPGRPGPADEMPPGVKADRDDAAVFFIHPTTDLSPSTGNAAFDAGGKTGAGVDVMMQFQASVFNGCCEVYAPRYRQASLHAITSHAPEDYAADALAYGDVARAFQSFLTRIGSRPFIIASHSQGSIHAVRLLQEKIIGRSLQGRLIAAYPVGTSLPRDIERLGLPICRDAEQTGCVVTWNAVRAGQDDPRRRNKAVVWWNHRYQPIGGRPLVCVNPLNWRLDGIAEAGVNFGGIHHDDPGKPIPAPIPGVTGAQCENGLLGIDIAPDRAHHYRGTLAQAGIYHVFDYALFYMNIRANAAERVAAYERLRR